MIPSSSPSEVPSTLPTMNFTAVVQQLTVDESNACNKDEFILHGQCAQCPSVLRSAVLVAVLVVSVLALVSYFILTAPFGTAVLFIGVEFLQLLSLVGITHVQWPKVMEIMFAFAAIVGLDIDIIAPMQCHFRLTSQEGHAVTMLLPLILSVTSICCLRLWYAFGRMSDANLKSRMNSIARLVMLGLVFGYMKLVLTSFEAVACSSIQRTDEDGLGDRGIDWFCFGGGNGGDKTIAIMGLVAFFIYGIGLPTGLCLMLRHYRENVRTDAQEAGVMIEIARVFLLTYCDDRWWWSVFVMARKLAFVLMVAFFQDVPILSLVFILIVTSFSATMQWKDSPYFQDTDEDVEGQEQQSKRSFSLFRHQTVDLILHGSIIATAILGILLTSISPTSDGRVGLGIFGLLTMIGSITLLLFAAFRSFKNRLDVEKLSEQPAMDESDATILDLEGGIDEDGFEVVAL